MNAQLEVRASIRHTVLLGLFYTLTAVFAIYIWSIGISFHEFTLYDCFRWIITLLVAFNCIRGWIPLFDRRPYLKITPEGVWVRNALNPFQRLRLLPWDTLYFFHFYTEKRRRQFSINLSGGTDYVAFRQKDADKDIDIVMSGADTNTEAIAKALNEYAAIYHFHDLGTDTRYLEY